MAKKKGKGKSVSVRKPRVTLNSRGLHVSPPSARVGSKQRGFNISKSGASYSIRTPFGVLNTRRGCSRTLPLLALPVLLLMGVAMIPMRWRRE
jgi:hypothetical protein